MADRQLSGVLRHIRKVAGPTDRDRSDRELLTAFAARGDQAAFAALVGRHGPMVLALCRRLLGHLQDAEDAFQATFLLLARRGAGIRKPESLASWLHGVAYRMAQHAKRAAARRRKYEAAAPRPSGGPAPLASPTEELAWREVQALLDAEIRRLPEIYRAPFILCCLENRPQADVARQLGIKAGTVWSRLAHARRLLQGRLARRGVALPAVLGFLAVSAEAARAAASGPLAASTVQAAAGGAGGASAEVLALVRGVGQAMTLAKYKIAAVLLAVLGVLGAGSGLALRQVAQGQAPEPARPQAPQAAQRPQPPPPSREQQPPPAAVSATPRRTVRVRGQLLDQDGRPVREALLLLVPLTAKAQGQGDLPVIRVKGGRFDAGECEEGANYAVLAVNGDWRRGGVSQLTVTAEYGGSLRVPFHGICCIHARFVQAPGEPVAPGYPIEVWVKGSGKEGWPAGLRVRLPQAFLNQDSADENGRIDVGLIPDVSCALAARGREFHEFVTRPGRVLTFGDLVVPAR